MNMDTLMNDAPIMMENAEEIMLNSLEDIKQKEDNFYNEKFYYSYSSLNKLLWNPQSFYATYVLGIREERLDAHLVQGKLIHLMLLQPEKFDDEFILTPASLPTGTLRTVIYSVFNHYKELSENGDERTELSEFSDAILDVMRDINYFQNLKTDQQRLDKVITPESITYWGFLKSKGNKTLVDPETYRLCTSIVDIIKTNKEICHLIGLDSNEFDNRQVLSEVEMKLDIPNLPYGLKGIIDNIVVNHETKTIYINDIKTSSKDLKNFPESIEYYAYWLQAIIYVIMVTKLFSVEMSNGYAMKFHFVVIDRNQQTYAFPVSENTLTTWFNRYEEMMKIAHWHYINKDYTLPYEFANNIVSL